MFLIGVKYNTYALEDPEELADDICRVGDEYGVHNERTWDLSMPAEMRVQTIWYSFAEQSDRDDYVQCVMTLMTTAKHTVTIICDLV